MRSSSNTTYFPGSLALVPVALHGAFARLDRIAGGKSTFLFTPMAIKFDQENHEGNQSFHFDSRLLTNSSKDIRNNTVLTSLPD